MGLALSLLVSLMAPLQVAATRSARPPAASTQGPPFVLAWRPAGASRMLAVVPRWAHDGTITLALRNGPSLAPRATTAFTVRAGQPFVWNPGVDTAEPRPMRVTATWRDPAGRAGATASAVWPEPAVPPAPQFEPMPPVRIHGVTLDQTVTLP